MFLVKNEKSNYKIAYKNNNLPAGFAAEELKKYLKLTTSCDLEICGVDTIQSGNVFHIGLYKDQTHQNKINATDLNGDGFVLEITENEIYLNAKTGRGLIFGVYRLLEEFMGVRFFNIDCEKVPQSSSVELPVGIITEKPDFAMRSYLAKMLPGKGEEYDMYHLKTKMCNEHRHLPEKLGGECPMYGRGGTHNMSRFVPVERYMDTHPEFYAVCDLYTTIDLLNGIADDGTLDETMDISVAKVVIEEMKKDILAYPDAVYFQFEQEDRSTTKAEYEEGSHKAEILAKYGRSGILVRFCNLIATELQKWADEELNGRKIYIVTFAYSYAKDPPVYEKDGKIYPIDQTVVPCDNLIIRMAFFSNCAYDYFDEKQTYIRELMKGWGAICNKFFFWAYDTDFADSLWYFPSLRNIKNNIKGFRDFGVQYMMFESADGTLTDWQSDVKAYVYGRLMWNADLSVNELYNEYMDAYYGVASDYVKKVMAIMENYSVYLESIYDKYHVDTFKETYRHIDLYPYSLFERTMDILDQAETAIKNLNSQEKEVLLERLARVKVTILHMKINKVNKELYANIELGKVTDFTGLVKIPENKKQTFYNSEMLYGVKVPIIIPDDIKQKVDSFDVYTIADSIDLDA